MKFKYNKHVNYYIISKTFGIYIYRFNVASFSNNNYKRTNSNDHIDKKKKKLQV